MSISKIDSGGITASGITADSLNIGQIGGRRNLIINGAMQVAQRGTSSTANGFNTVDRYFQGRSGGTRTFSQESLSSGEPYDLGLRKFFRFTNTTAGSNNATDYVESYYKIEAQDIASSGWNYTSENSYITLSFWVRSSVAGTYSFWMRGEDATSYTYGFTYTLAADTWTKVTHSIPGNSNLVFNNDNGAGLRIQWMAFYGSGYTSSSATLNAWTTGSALPDYATTWNTTAGATFDFTGVQLEVGTVATPFEHRSYGEELALCQRYYWQIGDGVSSDIVGIGGNFGSDWAYFSGTFPTKMRTTPTASVNNNTYFRCHSTSGSGINTDDFDALSEMSNTQYFVSFSGVSSFNAGSANLCFTSNSGGDKGIIKFDAEL